MNFFEGNKCFDDCESAFAFHTLRFTAAAGYIAHYRACEFFRNGDLDLVDGFENDRVSSLDGVFESHLSSFFERDFLTVNGVFLTVVECYFAVDEFAARKNAFSENFADTFFNCGDESAGDYAADDSVNEFEFAFAVRFENDVDFCEFARSARLFFVAVTCFCFSFDRFSVGDSRFKYFDVKSELVLDFLCQNFEVKFAETVNEKLFELGIVDHSEGCVFDLHLFDSSCDFIGIFLRSTCECAADDCFRPFDERERINFSSFVVGELVTGLAVFEFNGYSDLTCNDVFDRESVFASRVEKLAEFFSRRGRHVVDISTFCKVALKKFERIDFAELRNRVDFEDDTFRYGIIVGVDFAFAELHDLSFRRREEVNDGVKNYVDADAFVRCAEEYRINSSLRESLVETGVDFFFRKRAFVKVFGHKLFIALCDSFHELFLEFLDFVCELSRNLAFRSSFAVCVFNEFAFENVDDRISVLAGCSRIGDGSKRDLEFF